MLSVAKSESANNLIAGNRGSQLQSARPDKLEFVPPNCIRHMKIGSYGPNLLKSHYAKTFLVYSRIIATVVHAWFGAMATSAAHEPHTKKTLITCHDTVHRIYVQILSHFHENDFILPLLAPQRKHSSESFAPFYLADVCN